MVDRTGGGAAGSFLGMVAVAVVSAGVILASYHLIHRRLESNLKLNNTIARAEQRRHSRTQRKKKVRFADDVKDADTEECCGTADASGKLVRPVLRKAAYPSTRLAC
ncbi:unnamed protein product [Alopecurus aequalis]